MVVNFAMTDFEELTRALANVDIFSLDPLHSDLVVRRPHLVDLTMSCPGIKYFEIIDGRICLTHRKLSRIPAFKCLEVLPLATAWIEDSRGFASKFELKNISVWWRSLFPRLRQECSEFRFEIMTKGQYSGKYMKRMGRDMWSDRGRDMTGCDHATHQYVLIHLHHIFADPGSFVYDDPKDYKMLTHLEVEILGWPIVPRCAYEHPEKFML